MKEDAVRMPAKAGIAQPHCVWAKWLLNYVIFYWPIAMRSEA